MIHVYPMADEAFHELEGIHCWCGPTLEHGETDTIVVHNRRGFTDWPAPGGIPSIAADYAGPVAFQLPRVGYA